MMTPRRAAFLLAVSLALAGCGGSGGADAAGGPRLAFVTNGVDPFWTIARAGVRAAEKEFSVDCEVKMPAGGTVEEQRRIVEELLTREKDGIAISPIDAANLIDLIDEACDRTYLITHDSDAPGSKRLCYVGMDNYGAGRMCGQLVKEAMPEGGSVMIFIGRLEQDNAKKRRQGTIDELLDRDPDPERFDPPGEVPTGGKYTVLDTRTDQFDRSRAKANAEDAIALHADLGCMVGLFAYNAPACLEAVRAADKLGQIRIVSFDEQDPTLQGILDGHIQGTVTQNPYMYGWESVRILAGLARGDRSVLPDGGFLDVPARQVRKADAQQFWDELRARLKTSE